MGLVVIFDLYPGHILMAALEIFDRCPAYIGSVCWRYLIDVLEIFDLCAGDICWMKFRYLADILEILDRC